MTVFLLDTNVVSEVRKRKPHGAVLSWLNALPPENMFLPAVVLGELQAGAEITRMQDAEKALEIEDWIDHITSTLSVVAMDSANMRVSCRGARTGCGKMP